MSSEPGDECVNDVGGPRPTQQLAGCTRRSFGGRPYVDTPQNPCQKRLTITISPYLRDHRRHGDERVAECFPGVKELPDPDVTTFERNEGPGVEDELAHAADRDRGVRDFVAVVVLFDLDGTGALFARFCSNSDVAASMRSGDTGPNCRSASSRAA